MVSNRSEHSDPWPLTSNRHCPPQNCHSLTSLFVTVHCKTKRRLLYCWNPRRSSATNIHGHHVHSQVTSIPFHLHSLNLSKSPFLHLHSQREWPTFVWLADWLLTLAKTLTSQHDVHPWSIPKANFCKKNIWMLYQCSCAKERIISLYSNCVRPAEKEITLNNSIVELQHRHRIEANSRSLVSEWRHNAQCLRFLQTAHHWWVIYVGARTCPAQSEEGELPLPFSAGISAQRQASDSHLPPHDIIFAPQKQCLGFLKMSALA